MPTLPPIQLPGARSSPRRPLTTHAIAAVTSAALAVGGTVAYQQQSATPPAAEQPVPTTYASRLQSAWRLEQAADASKADQLRRLAFLYRATILALETGEFKSAKEMSAGFKQQESVLEMTAKLPMLRAVVTTEWHAQHLPGTGALLPVDRVAITSFMRQTVSLIEGLP